MERARTLARQHVEHTGHHVMVANRYSEEWSSDA